MEIKNTFLHMASKPDLHSAVGVANNKSALDLNCMRIGIVQEFYKEDLTVSVLIANKRDSKQYSDGTEATRNYALIRAKVCYCNPFVSYEIKEGDECVLLFSDREIESWFINGNVNPVAYPRMHDLTDAVAIFGIRSIPNMIEILSGCLHIFHTKVLVDNLHASNGVTGNFVSKDNKGVTVTDGIITDLTGASPSPDITADDIINALDYTPADIDLSNLSATGKTVIDGQWVNLNRLTIANEVSPHGTTALPFVLSDVPDDGYEYEVLISGIAQTTSTSESNCNIYIYSDKFSGELCLCRLVARTNAVAVAGGNAILPLTTSRKMYLHRTSGYTGSVTLFLHGYRRIGTNT